MLATVATRSPSISPSAARASSAFVTWSRPWASARNDSERSARHFTGRLSLPAAQVTAISSAYTKIFEPKPPPTSGDTTRSLCSGATCTNAAITRRAKWGFCDVV